MNDVIPELRWKLKFKFEINKGIIGGCLTDNDISRDSLFEIDFERTILARVHF